MRQYLDAKRQHRDAIVFFRMGDFYEMFYEDALVAARALDLTLTSRSKDAGGDGIPMCGVPFHAVDGYLAKLVQKGLPRRDLRAGRGSEEGEGARQARGRPRRLARHADRRELPRRARTGVPDGDRRRQRQRAAGNRSSRHSTTARQPRLHSASRSSISRPASSRPPNTHGADGLQALADEIAVLRPREIVVPVGLRTIAGRQLPEIARLQIPVTTADAWSFEPEAARRSLLDQLKTHGLDGFGLDGRVGGDPGGRRTRRLSARHAEGRPRARARDHATRPSPTACVDRSDHAEASRGRRPAAKADRRDRCSTRSIAPSRRWAAGCCARGCSARSSSLERIRDRLDAVEELAFRSTDRGKFREVLKTVHDLERLVGARRARHGRPARSRGAPIVARRRSRASG